MEDVKKKIRKKEIKEKDLPPESGSPVMHNASMAHS